MALWSIEPTVNESVIERYCFDKDKNRIIVEIGYRWGEFICKTSDDTPPKIVGSDLWDCGYDINVVEMYDVYYEVIGKDKCDEVTREWFEEFLKENSWHDLEDNGWTKYLYEFILDCKPEIKMIKTTVQQREETECE